MMKNFTAFNQSIPQGSLPVHYSLGARELVAIGWRRKWYVVLCLAFTLALGAVYYVRADRLYQVSTRLLVEKQGLPLDSAPNQQDKGFLATQAEIIGSPAVAESAAKKVHWPEPLKAGVVPTKKLLAGMTVQPVMGTQVISVSYRSHDLPHALDAVKEIIASYRLYLQQAEQDTSFGTLRLLTQSEKDLRTDLERLQREYRELRKQGPLTSQGKNGAAAQLLLAQQVGQKLTEARNRRIELKNQLQMAQSWSQVREATHVAGRVRFEKTAVAHLDESHVDQQPALPVRHVAATRPLATTLLLSQAIFPDGADVATLQSQLTAAQLREQELAERFGYKNAELRAVRQQIEALEGSLRDVLDAAPEVLQQQLAAVESSEQRLDELYRSELANAKELDNYLLKEQQAMDQIERVQLLHDSVLTQLQQSELTNQALADGGSPVRVGVLQAPEPPSEPLWPAPLIVLIVSTAVGLACAGGLVVIAEYRQPTFPQQRIAAALHPDAADDHVPSDALFAGAPETSQGQEQFAAQFT